MLKVLGGGEGHTLIPPDVKPCHILTDVKQWVSIIRTYLLRPSHVHVCCHWLHVYYYTVHTVILSPHMVSPSTSCYVWYFAKSGRTPSQKKDTDLRATQSTREQRKGTHCTLASPSSFYLRSVHNIDSRPCVALRQIYNLTFSAKFFATRHKPM